jgi:hypothetical protein
MVKNEKIKQVFNAIKENGINAFDDEALAKLLSILSPQELDEFENSCYTELEGTDALLRIMNIKPLVEVLINSELYRIRISPAYNKYIESLNDGTYYELFKKLKPEELADLKKYISYTVKIGDEVNESGTKKIVNLITNEIKARDQSRKPKFEETF